jgi:hypothetical protein
MENRFVVFAGGCYPRGGWADMHSLHSSEESAVATADEWLKDGVKRLVAGYFWVQVVDLESTSLILHTDHS